MKTFKLEALRNEFPFLSKIEKLSPDAKNAIENCRIKVKKLDETVICFDYSTLEHGTGFNTGINEAKRWISRWIVSSEGILEVGGALLETIYELEKVGTDCSDCFFVISDYQYFGGDIYDYSNELIIFKPSNKVDFTDLIKSAKLRAEAEVNSEINF